MSKFTAIKDLTTSKLGRPLLHLSKHSPRILFVAGTVGVIGTVVLACRATLKVSDVLDEAEAGVSKIKAKVTGRDKNEPLSMEDGDKEIRKLQLKTALEIAKPYLPAIALGIVSIGALTGSHVILTKRNGAVMAAYAALDRGFKEYRQRVLKEYGEDVDRMFMRGDEEIDVTETLADGKTKTTKKVVSEGRWGGSPYAFIFDEQSHKFSKQPGVNAMTVEMTQNWATQKLRAQGHLFLNELFDMLGMPHTQAGAVVGWVYKPHDTTHSGDNYVDFNIFNGDHENVSAFIDGNHYYVTIDPNVDGTIWDKI